ncbi:MAG: F0F1 ATP synthase subunit epsilon [Myxococcota bacterium]
MGLGLSIVTPERTVVDEEVDEVVLPGEEGEFGVLPSHEPFLSALRPGVVRYQVGGQAHLVAMSTGFVEVSEEHTVVLARTAEHPSEIDPARADAARARAEQELREPGLSREAAARLEGAVARAAARRSVVG